MAAKTNDYHDPVNDIMARLDHEEKRKNVSNSLAEPLIHGGESSYKHKPTAIVFNLAVGLGAAGT